jgi:hypothetical protein
MAPLFPSSPTFENALVRVWFFDESATVVTQVLSPAMNLATAAFLAAEVQAEVEKRYGAKGRKVRYLHDWRGCSSYEVAARDRLMEWGKVGRPMTEETIIGISPSASPFLQIALSTGTFVMRRIGMKISVVPNLDELLAALSPRAK